jgi:hypothetical protein
MRWLVPPRRRPLRDTWQLVSALPSLAVLQESALPSSLVLLQSLLVPSSLVLLQESALPSSLVLLQESALPSSVLSHESLLVLVASAHAAQLSAVAPHESLVESLGVGVGPPGWVMTTPPSAFHDPGAVSFSSAVGARITPPSGSPFVAAAAAAPAGVGVGIGVGVGDRVAAAPASVPPSALAGASAASHAPLT